MLLELRLCIRQCTLYRMRVEPSLTFTQSSDASAAPMLMWVATSRHLQSERVLPVAGLCVLSALDRHDGGRQMVPCIVWRYDICVTLSYTAL